jgi:inhibitor of KinA sporulation pathway (predicted exonuclease)
MARLTPEIFTSLDLEMNQPSGKIIQVGACVGNLVTGEILEKLDVLVQLDEPLNPYITALTSITQEDLDARAVPIDTAYLQLKAMHERHGSHTNPITWGGGDSRELLDQLELYFETLPEARPDKFWVFGRRWFDVKTVVQLYCIHRNIKMQGGLSKMMGKFGLQFQGRKHYAIDDAINTFRFAHHLRRLFVTKLND